MVDSLQWFYPVETEVTSNLLCLAWRLRLHPIVGSNDPNPDPIYASLRLAFHPKCVLSARKCIAQYRLKFQIIHCQFFSGYSPASGWPVNILGRAPNWLLNFVGMTSNHQKLDRKVYSIVVGNDLSSTVAVDINCISSHSCSSSVQSVVQTTVS